MSGCCEPVSMSDNNVKHLPRMDTKTVVAFLNLEIGSAAAISASKWRVNC